MPIIAFPSKGKGGLNAVVETRFGKSESITFVSLENEKVESVKIIPIAPTDAMGNLGKHVARIIENNNASIALVRFIGFKSFKSLQSKNILIYEINTDDLTIKECIDLYKQGNFIILSESNAHLMKN